MMGIATARAIADLVPCCSQAIFFVILNRLFPANISGLEHLKLKIERTRFMNGNRNFTVILYSSIEFFTIHFSVRLSDGSKVSQNKINFIKNGTQWGLNSQPPDHQSTALSTVLSHYLVVLVNH